MSIIREERIGDCRLILGSATDIVPTLGEIDSIACDPPYGMAFRSNHRKQRHNAIANDGDVSLLRWACEVPVRHSAYVWGRWDNLLDAPKPRSFITWVKNNWSMGDLEHEHARQTEVCFFYRGPEHFFPKGRPADVVTFPRTGNNFHPTEKPVGLMQAVVSWTDGTVLDCFMGSGSTLVACAKLGRPSVGIEIDPIHFETACKRVEEAYRQPDLFVAPSAPQPKQEGFDL